MALLYIEGFDLTTPPDASVRFTGGTFGDSTVARTGKCWRLDGSGAFNFPAGVSEGVLGYAYVAVNVEFAAGLALLTLKAGATSVAAIRLKAGDNTKIELLAGATVVATVDRPAPFLNTYAFLEVGWSIGAGTGKLSLSWNGSPLAAVTGLAMGTAPITSAAYPSPTSGSRVDDLYLLDSTGPAPYNAALGDCRVETLRPTGDGAENAWTGSDGNSVANWQLVDDDNTTTDYVLAATAGLRDLYALADPTGAALGDVLAVQVQAYVAKSDAGTPPGPINGVLRSSSGAVVVDELISAAALSTSWQEKQSAIRTVDPDGTPWTVSAVTNLQAGVEIP